MFNKYRIPKDNLLNRTGDVTVEGEYESSFSDPQRILGELKKKYERDCCHAKISMPSNVKTIWSMVLGAVLENLSAGRMGISQESTNSLGMAIVIAVRYAACRKQFASSLSSEIETPIIEYELHVCC